MKTETTAVNADNNLIQIDIEAKYLKQVLTALNYVMSSEMQGLTAKKGGRSVFINGNGIFYPDKTEMISTNGSLISVFPLTKAIPNLRTFLRQDEVKDIVKVLQPKAKTNGSMVTLKFADSKQQYSMIVEAPAIHKEYPLCLPIKDVYPDIRKFYKDCVTDEEHLVSLAVTDVNAFKKLLKQYINQCKDGDVCFKFYPKRNAYAVVSRGKYAEKFKTLLEECPLPDYFKITSTRDISECPQETVVLSAELMDIYTRSASKDRDFVFEINGYDYIVPIAIHHNDSEGMGVMAQWKMEDENDKDANSKSTADTKEQVIKGMKES